MTHLINGMAGNIESHSTLSGGVLNITAVLDQTHYGFSKLTIVNSTALKWTFVRGDGGIIGDELTLLKKPGSTGGGNGTSSSAAATATTYLTTKTVTAYTTYCPYATTFTQGNSTYAVTGVSPLALSIIPATKLTKNLAHNPDNHKLSLHTHIHHHRPYYHANTHRHRRHRYQHSSRQHWNWQHVESHSR